MRRTIARVFVAAISATLVPALASAQLTSTPQFFQMDPTGMYLRGDGAFGLPLILDLGVAIGGRTLFLNPTGILQVAGSGSPYHAAGFCGVFSSSSTLLASTQLNRVADAISPPASVFGTCPTAQTFYGQQSTDLAEDFSIPPAGATIDVPIAARYLFVAVADDYAPDNVSPDPAHYGLNASMTTVPEPSALALSGIGLSLLALAAARKRRVTAQESRD